jgi:hypothetical protein
MFNSSLFNTTLDANSTLGGLANNATTAMPTAFCSLGQSTLFLAFALALVGDLILQFYQVRLL